MNRYAILFSVFVLAACAGAEPVPCADADGDGYGDGCALGPDCRDDDPAIHAGAPEACEGADSDCDGTIDEGCGCVDGQVEACGSDVGECRAGTATCAGGALGACAGAIEAAIEICDGGADEDCDGTIDEGCACATGAERPCGSDVGECSAGVQRCAAGSWSACEGGVTPSLEACDGVLDEDCDGVADDGCDCVDGATRACGSDVGACRAGTQTCEGGAWGACMGAIGPAPEICDGREDESCDGAVDEGCDCTDGATRACGSDTGACSAGAQTCAGGTWGACDGAIDPVAETCDGVRDDDCDGAVDEDCDCTNGATRACGLDAGACEPGVQSCVLGAWAACEGAAGPRTEACDGALDDDCDGVVDEGCECVDGATRACGSDTGACAAGAQTCVTGYWGTCTGGVGPRTEVCEGVIDEDCDGQVDDGCACVNGMTQACGTDVGACVAGVRTCRNGAFGSCAGSVGPITELCDNAVDDDCDGLTDEGCPPRSVVDRTIAWAPSIALDRDERPHLLYHAWSTDDHYYARWDGSRWLIEAAPLGAAAASTEMLALDPATGEAWVGACRYDVNRLYVYHRAPDGAWTSEEVDPTLRCSSSVELRFGPDGLAYLMAGGSIFATTRPPQVRMYRHDAGGWTSLGIPASVPAPPSWGSAGISPDFAVTAGGDVHFAARLYYDDGGPANLIEEIDYRVWHAGSWSAAERVTPSTWHSEYPISLVLTGGGAPVRVSSGIYVFERPASPSTSWTARALMEESGCILQDGPGADLSAFCLGALSATYYTLHRYSPASGSTLLATYTGDVPTTRPNGATTAMAIGPSGHIHIAYGASVCNTTACTLGHREVRYSRY